MVSVFRAFQFRVLTAGVAVMGMGCASAVATQDQEAAESTDWSLVGLENAFAVFVSDVSRTEQTAKSLSVFRAPDGMTEGQSAEWVLTAMDLRADCRNRTIETSNFGFFSLLDPQPWTWDEEAETFDINDSPTHHLRWRSICEGSISDAGVRLTMQEATWIGQLSDLEQALDDGWIPNEWEEVPAEPGSTLFADGFSRIRGLGWVLIRADVSHNEAGEAPDGWLTLYHADCTGGQLAGFRIAAVRDGYVDGSSYRNLQPNPYRPGDSGPAADVFDWFCGENRQDEPRLRSTESVFGR